MSFLGWSNKAFHSTYSDGTWKIESYPTTISPFSAGIQYGQSVIEGLKAYKTELGYSSIFRLKDHYKRLLKSIDYLGLPRVEFDFFKSAIQSVIEDKEQWEHPLQSDVLYIRPIIFGVDGGIFPVTSDRCAFSVYVAPVLSFRQESVTIEFFKNVTRTSPNGLSAAKSSSSYAPILSRKEQSECVQVWYDPVSDFIEEADTSNIFFVLNNGKVLTPIANNRILSGITRSSIIELILNEVPFEIEERNISTKEIYDFINSGNLREIFLTSTGIGIQGCNSIKISDCVYTLNPKDSLCDELFRIYSEIVTARSERYNEWNDYIKMI